MSAYLCDAQIFGLLANYAVKHKATEYDDLYGLEIKTTDKIVDILVQANLISVGHRYPDLADNPALYSSPVLLHFDSL